VLVGHLHQLLAVAQSTSVVLVFIQRPGDQEPEVAEVVRAIDIPTEDAFVLYVEARE
jgi:hypothetical protein